MLKEAMKRKSVKSSNISSVGYSAPLKHLEVEFKNGGIYKYKGVPKSSYNALMQSGSKGKFFHKNIRGGYPYKKILTPDGEKVKESWNETLMKKVAALNTDVKLRPHQQRIADDDNPSKIVAHGVGSGKTLSAIARFEKMRERGNASKALVVVPASLRDNFAEKGVGKFTNSKANVIGNKQEISSGKRTGADPEADYNIVSYEMFRKNPQLLVEMTGADSIIYDEAHKGKNESTLTTKAIQESRPLFKNYTGLTGSVISNSIADVQPLYSAATGGSTVLGKNKKDFEKMFLVKDNSPKYKDVSDARRPVTGLKNKAALKRELKGIVDYLSPEESTIIADMPEKKVKVVKVPITREQAKYYKGILKDNPAVRDMIRQKRLETLKDDEASRAFNAMIEARKLMNSVGSIKKGIPLDVSAKITPKADKILNDLEKHLKQDPDNQALLMSHLIRGGTDVLEAGLQDRGIDYGRFIGKGNEGVTEETRQQAVRDYNNRKNRVMVISGAGGEGLSLDDTTWEGVFDPHYNPEKMNQMEARGIRSGGLSGRDDRSVAVNRYIATMPKTFGLFPTKTRTPDEFIYEIAQKKQKQNDIFFDFLDDIKDKRRKSMVKESSEMNYKSVVAELYKQAAPGGRNAVKTYSGVGAAGLDLGAYLMHDAINDKED